MAGPIPGPAFRAITGISSTKKCGKPRNATASPREKMAQTTATSGKATATTEAIMSPVMIALLVDRQLRFAVRSGGTAISAVKFAALTFSRPLPALHRALDDSRRNQVDQDG